MCLHDVNSTCSSFANDCVDSYFCYVFYYNILYFTLKSYGGQITTFSSDVWRQKPRLEVAKVLPRPCLDVLMSRSRLGLNVMTSKLRYYINIHNFHPFIFCMSLRPLRLNFIYVYNSATRCKLNVFGLCVVS